MIFLSDKCLNRVFSILLLVDDELFKKMAYIVVECYIAARDRYGIYSMEFVVITAHAISILEKIYAKANLKCPSDETDRNKIIKLLSLKQMRKSWTILSTNTRQMFENFVKNNLVEKTPYECGCKFMAQMKMAKN